MEKITRTHLDQIYSTKRYSKFGFDWSKTTIIINKLSDCEELRQKAFQLTSAGSRDFTISDQDSFMMPHSPTRLDMFFIQMYHIPNYLSVHLVRHGKFAEHFVKTGREDRNGPDNETRWSPKDHGIFTNAQEIMQIARMRLCEKADKNAQFMLECWKKSLLTLSPHLSKNMVPKCVYRNGICDEGKMSCGKLKLKLKEHSDYFDHFSAANIISRLVD